MENFKCFIISVFILLISFNTHAALVNQKILTNQTFPFKGTELQAISGVFYFEFDPLLQVNQTIVDIEHAATNAQGMVEAQASFFIIQPKDASKRKAALVEISNRGSKASLNYFNLAKRTAVPNTAAALGDGLIQDLGLSLMWIGWQGDVPIKSDLLYADLPRAQGVTGKVRSDWTIEQTKSMLSIAHRDSIATIYPLDKSQKQQAYLTHRMGREGLKDIVPASQWQFSPDGSRIVGNFTPGIYELVYPAKDPMVIGLGLAIVRDTAEYVKTKGSSYYAPKTLAFGVSQTGRFLRHFLHQGFNETELGFKAFDGMFIHTAGAGRGSFNHRFAQPSRDGHRMSAFQYPTDLFPFTSERVRSPYTNKKRGLLKRYHQDFYPKTFYTNTGYDYWGRAASLIHTNEIHDIKPLPHERIYHFASTQHYVHSTANMKLIDKEHNIYQGNPLNFKLHLRALLSHLTDWVITYKKPPGSSYPSFAKQTLINFSHYQPPKWLGIEKPYKPHTVYEMDLGEKWAQGIIEVQPPIILAETTPAVPNIDTNGNEVGGIIHPLLKAPIATFLPWVLRSNTFANNEMADFTGAVKKWPTQRIKARYSSKKSYLKHLEKMSRKSLSQGWLLARDLNRVQLQGNWLWDWSMNQPKPLYTAN